MGNIVNKNNGLKLTSSTDGGIISGADTSQAAEVTSPQTYQISMTGSNGDSATKTISGVSIPKNATVTLTGSGGACSEETNTVTWTIPVLNAGESLRKERLLQLKFLLRRLKV